MAMSTCPSKSMGHICNGVFRFFRFFHTGLVTPTPTLTNMWSCSRHSLESKDLQTHVVPVHIQGFLTHIHVYVCMYLAPLEERHAGTRQEHTHLIITRKRVSQISHNHHKNHKDLQFATRPSSEEPSKRLFTDVTSYWLPS
jgi:hypothetical protein